MAFTLSKTDKIVVDLEAKFEKEFGEKAVIAGRAPGRVNLIGEHIDYCGFSVFPMALEGKFTTSLMKPNDSGKLRIRHLNDDMKGQDVDILPYTELKATGWCKYVESSVKTFCETFKFDLKGLDIIIYGNVPLASGLSSSAALICSITTALNKISGKNIDKSDIVEASVEAEHRVGVMCGGMDQAISVYGEDGFADIISFKPKLSAKPVKLPPAHFIIAHSAQSSAKVETADDCYNRRVEEVTRCAELMMPGAKIIGEVVQKYGWDKALELAEGLPEKEGKLFLRKRAVHVVSEAHRVIMMEGASFEEWGKLMYESHASCRDNYNCSCEALDTLVECGRKNGATGGRLTGAGWGGCTVFMLAPEKDPEAFIAAIKKEFYEPRGVKDPIIFATKPGEGAHAISL
jgi:N-acetylgalactosamine kinase